MKKHIWVTALTASLLLAACNTDEESTAQNNSNTDTATEVTENKAEQPIETEESSVSTEATTVSSEESTQSNKTTTETKSEQLVIYGGDDNAENIIVKSTVDYSFAKDGGISQFLLEQLNLSSYYNKHTVSGDEKTITLDLQDSILTAPEIQGSAGAAIFSDSLAVTFFKNVPNLETLKIRVNDEEQQLDHTSIFTGEITRASVAEKFPELVK